MAAKLRTRMSDALNAAQVAISNTLADAGLQGLVAEFGYDAARMQEGRALYEAAVQAMNARTGAVGAHRDATAKVKAAEATARAAYQALAQVARAVFVHEREHLAALGLAGSEPRSLAGFLMAAQTLFHNAQRVEAVRTALAAYGYDEAKLRAEGERSVAFDRMSLAQQAAKGAAEQATQDQNAAFAELQDWVSQYTKIAKVALRERKELLEKLGIRARSAKTAAQRAAPEKAAATRAAKHLG